MTLETLIQFRRHWRAIDMLLEREINQMQEEHTKEPKPMTFAPGEVVYCDDVIKNDKGEIVGLLLKEGSPAPPNRGTRYMKT